MQRSVCRGVPVFMLSPVLCKPQKAFSSSRCFLALPPDIAKLGSCPFEISPPPRLSLRVVLNISSLDFYDRLQLPVGL